jgi:hypothetical protein
MHADAAHSHVAAVAARKCMQMLHILTSLHANELSCTQMTANTFLLLATHMQPVFASDCR